MDRKEFERRKDALKWSSDNCGSDGDWENDEWVLSKIEEDEKSNEINRIFRETYQRAKHLCGEYETNKCMSIYNPSLGTSQYYYDENTKRNISELLDLERRFLEKRRSEMEEEEKSKGKICQEQRLQDYRRNEVNAYRQLWGNTII